MLTSFSGERRRADSRPAAEAFLGLLAQQEITAGILLRGVQGFGHRRQLRTDRSLTLSEDLPLVTVALGASPGIESALEQAAPLARAGLVTLQRAQLLDGDATQHVLPDGAGEEEARLSVFFTSQDQVFSIPAFEAICDLLRRRGITSATAFLGVDGIMRGRRMHARFLGRHAEVPMMILAVGPRQRILQVIPEVGGLLRNPVMTVEPVRTCKRDGEFLAIPDRLPGAAEHGMARWQRLSVYAPETAQHDGQALHRALVQRLLAADVRGATTLRGVWGFHGDRTQSWHGARRVTRDKPAVTIVLDAPERIPAAFAIIDEVTADRGLVTSELVAARPAAAELPGHPA